MSGISGLESNELQLSPRYLIRQPIALQWFEDGKLVKRCEGERQAGKYKLASCTRYFQAHLFRTL
jgi:hypothetical protein